MEPKITAEEVGRGVRLLVIVATLAISTVFITSGLYAKYRIWWNEQRGQATLAEARYSRQVKIEEAKSNLEAQKLNAQAELVRARGAAESIKAEAGTLTENYIRYLWVRQQDNLNNKTVVYIPTEGGLPVLESTRLQPAAGNPQ